MTDTIPVLLGVPFLPNLKFNTPVPPIKIANKSTIKLRVFIIKGMMKSTKFKIVLSEQQVKNLMSAVINETKKHKP
jgi:hypothetical protein